MIKKRLVVIGGGAAGFFCAINAAQLNPALEVLIIEKSSKVLSKVRISGGGRCNVTHHCFSIAEMIKKYPRGNSFLKKSFHHFFTTDTIEWFNKRGVALKSEADGRMFPVSNTSETIVQCLMQEVNKFGVQLLLNRDVQSLINIDGIWKIIFRNEESITADFVCVACGGFNKAEQFNWLTATGHSIEAPVPSLFTFNMPNNTITQLMGITVEQAQVKIIGSSFQQQGPLLITHWGLSGPAILKLSAWAARDLAQKNWHFSVAVNWLPNYNEQTLKEKIQQIRFEQAPQKMFNKNPFGLPIRLWQYLLQQSDINDTIRWADLPAKEQNKLIKNICTQVFEVKGKTTFKEEFVTAGGIQLNEVDFNTMQSKIVPNLFFAGEVLNIDGVTGGFNFQSAWTTGYLAGKTIAQNSKQ
jgi:predicted Rossmann fold flavoprotein